MGLRGAADRRPGAPDHQPGAIIAWHPIVPDVRAVTRVPGVLGRLGCPAGAWLMAAARVVGDAKGPSTYEMEGPFSPAR